MLRPRAAIFFALYVCAVVYLSLYPWEFLLYPRGTRLVWAPLVGRRQVLDVALNVLFYVPLGIAGFLAVRRGVVGWLVTIGVGCGTSWAIEWLQLWCPTRFGNLTDLAANAAGSTLGATAGYLAARGRWNVQLRQSPALSRWKISPEAGLLLAAWLFWQAFPFIPAISLLRMERLPASMDPWSWRIAAENAIGFAVLRWALGRSPWLAVAWAALLAQAFLLDRTMAPAAMFGALAGGGLAELVGEKRRALSWVLPAWLVFEELRPFSFAGERHAIRWAPFGSWYEIASTGYYPVLFGKLFLYSAVTWGLRERGLGWRWAVGVPVGILAAGEWAQQYVPGRTAETTDLVVAIAGAILLRLCNERERAG